MTDKIIIVDGNVYKLVPELKILDFKKYKEMRSAVYNDTYISEEVDCVFRIIVKRVKYSKLDTPNSCLNDNNIIEFGKMENDYSDGNYFSGGKEIVITDSLTDNDKQEIIKHIEENLSDVLYDLSLGTNRQDQNVERINDYLDGVCKELNVSMDELIVLYNNSKKEYG